MPTPRLKPQRDDAGKLLLRCALAVIILCHGVFKVTHGVDWIKQPLGNLGLPGFLAYGTYLAEVAAPIFLLVGYRVRLAAVVIALDILMAIVLVMRAEIFALKPGGGGWGIELEALIVATAVGLSLVGGGRYGLTGA
jgi:putative oxidoreductase